MTTKEQELKALDQIKKILSGLGENSYIGIAMEGMIEDAEENIKNDFGCSMKDRWQHAEKRLDELTTTYNQQMCKSAEKIRKLESVVDEVEHQRDLTRKELELAKKTLHDESDRANIALENAKTLNHSYCESLEKIRTMQETIDRKDLEIIKLKARLFDLMEK